MRRLLFVLTLPLGFVTSSPIAAHDGDHAGGPSFVLIQGSQNSTTMSGTLEDYRRAKAFRSGRESLLYMRRDGVSYIVRDPATIAQANTIFGPERTLGAQQAELGSQQEGLGVQQEALGAQQKRLGRRQARASPHLAAALSRDQDALGQQQSTLGAKQEVLGRQQESLGRQVEEASRVAKGKLSTLFDGAIRDGRARRVN